MMQRLYLMLREVAGSRFVSCIVLLSVVLSVFAVGLFRIAGDSLSSYIHNRFASSIPPNTIRISTRQPRTLFLFETSRPGGPVINDRVIKRIRAMEGVTEVLPVSALRIPIQARVSYLGFNYRSDILAFGVPQRLVAGELAGDRYRRLWRDPEREQVIPVLIPRAILQSYNDGMAASNNLPRISERGAVGFGFRLSMGRSSLRTLDGHRDMDAVVAGFTDQVDSFALILPLALVSEYNRKFVEKYRNEYQYAYVRVGSHAAMLRVSPAIQRMGLVVEAEKGVSQQIMKLKETVTLIIRLLQSIIVIIAVIAISFATMIAVFNRIEYYRTLRLVGASRAFLTLTILAKYLIIGFAGAWVGAGLLRYASARVTECFHLTGFMISVSLPEDAFRAFLLAGMAVPVLSAVPALVRLYVKGLSGD
ncbi:MAG TPA: hypothetical protein PKX40_13745 [Spirochaetota bacterium]|nr:hypothetical protein [Spirochaetota bacterium]